MSDLNEKFFQCLRFSCSKTSDRLGQWHYTNKKTSSPHTHVHTNLHKLFNSGIDGDLFDLHSATVLPQIMPSTSLFCLVSCQQRSRPCKIWVWAMVNKRALIKHLNFPTAMSQSLSFEKFATSTFFKYWRSLWAISSPPSPPSFPRRYWRYRLKSQGIGFSLEIYYTWKTLDAVLFFFSFCSQ